MTEHSEHGEHVDDGPSDDGFPVSAEAVIDSVGQQFKSTGGLTRGELSGSVEDVFGAFHPLSEDDHELEPVEGTSNRAVLFFRDHDKKIVAVTIVSLAALLAIKKTFSIIQRNRDT